MQKFVQWLIQSSANPEEKALTVKGILMGFIPLFVMLLRIGNIEIAPQKIEEAIIIISAIVSGLVTLVGLVRKLWLTFRKPST